MPSRKISLFKVTLLSIVMSGAFANLRKRPPPTNQIGLGSSFSSDLYKEGDSFSLPVVPSINYTYKKFSFRGISASYSIAPLTKLYLTPDFNSVDPDDGEYNEGLTERKKSLDLGVTIFIPSPWFFTNLSYSHDISGRSKADKYSIALSKVMNFNYSPTKKITFIPGIYYSKYSSSWSQYYFGVSQDEEKSDREAFNPGPAHRFGGRFLINYPLTQKIGINALYSFTKFSDAVGDSPLTRTNNRSSVFIAINYILGPATVK